MPQSVLDALDDVQGRHAPVPPGGDILGTLDAVQGRGGASSAWFIGPDGKRIDPDEGAAPLKADTRSLFARGYDATFTAPEFVTRAADTVADAIDQPSLNRSHLRAQIQGFLAGSVQGAASLLTPGDVALAFLGSRWAKPLMSSARLAQATQTLSRAASLGTAVRGAERMMDADSFSDAAAGVAQMAFGGAGLAAGRAPQPAPETSPRLTLPAGVRYAVAPDGRVAPAGTDIPMTPTPDGSYVRGVPAEYPRRAIRGELPPGPRFHADASGNVASADRASELLSVLDDVQGRRPQAPDVSGVRSVPAAVIDREIDPTVPASRSVKVRQFSGDVGATDAPFVSPEQRRVLEVMREDLREFTPQRGTRITDPHDRTSSIYAHGTPGSPVGDDIRVIAGAHVSNAEVRQAVDDLLAGKAPSNKLHTAALDAANGYLEGREGYRGPVLPLNGPAASGGDPVNEFERFAAMLEEVPEGEARYAREPGEEGFATPAFLAHLGGGMAGAAAGAASGETTEDKLKRGLLFGVAGAVAPALLRSGAGSSALNAATRATSPGTVLPMPPRGAGRSGTPIDEPMRGMEPFLAKFSNPLVRDGIEQLIAENNGFAQQRRGVIDNTHLGRFAAEVRVNATRSLPKGTALNAESITAYARALQESQRRVNELAQRVTGAQSTDADLIALQAAKAEAETIGKSLIGARAEAGRALAAFNFYRGILDTGDVTIIRDALKAPGLREDAEKLAKGLAAQPNDPILRFRWLQQQTGSTLWDKARSVYYANILSGVKTHERNVLGNVANIATNLVTHPFAVGADVARSVTTGAPRTLSLDELPAQTVGLVSGMNRGFRDALFTLRHGVSPGSLSRSLEAGAAGKLDVPRVELGGGAANPFNWPGRSLDAADVFFRSMAQDAERYGLAHMQAKREGLTGSAFDRRVAELRTGQTPEGQQIQTQAADFARRAVFQEQPGKFSAWLSQGNQVPGLRYVMPFVLPFIKTPANIARQGFEFSPAGALMKAARQGGRAGEQAQGRAAAGTLAAGYLAYLASTGQISGDGPKDTQRRAALMESGWRPNSIKLGDRWVGYQLFQPVGLQASLIANAFDAWRESGAKPKDAPDMLAQTIARSANSFLDQSFLSGLFSMAEALNDPERSAARFAGQVASGAIPFSGAARTVAQATDPIVRSPRTIVDTVKAGIPGLSQDVPARLTRFGEPTVREGGPVQRAADPFNTAQVVDDPIAQELDRLGVEVPQLTADRMELPGGLKFTPEQALAARQMQGRAMRQALEAVMSKANYRAMPDRMKEIVIRRSIEVARDRMATELRAQMVSRPR